MYVHAITVIPLHIPNVPETFHSKIKLSFFKWSQIFYILTVSLLPIFLVFTKPLGKTYFSSRHREWSTVGQTLIEGAASARRGYLPTKIHHHHQKRYSPGWALVSSTQRLHNTRLCTFVPHPFTPIIHRSAIMLCIHRNPGLPPSSRGIDFSFQFGWSSCIDINV